jgi:hypothetical protein
VGGEGWISQLYKYVMLQISKRRSNARRKYESILDDDIFCFCNNESYVQKPAALMYVPVNNLSDQSMLSTAKGGSSSDKTILRS